CTTSVGAPPYHCAGRPSFSITRRRGAVLSVRFARLLRRAMRCRDVPAVPRSAPRRCGQVRATRHGAGSPRQRLIGCTVRPSYAHGPPEEPKARREPHMRCLQTRPLFRPTAVAAAIAGCFAPGTAQQPPGRPTVVASNKLPNVPGKTLTAVLVRYAPG